MKRTGGVTMRPLIGIVLLIGLVWGAPVAAQNANDWPTVGNDPGGMKYLAAHADHAGQRQRG